MFPRLFSWLLLSCCAIIVKAQFPDLSTYVVSQSGTTNFSASRGGDAGEMSKTEVPPWIVGGGNKYRSYFLTDGSNGGVFSSQQDMVSDAAIDPAHGLGPFWVSFSAIKVTDGGCPLGRYAPWRRDYYGVYSAQYLSSSQGGPVTLGFLHAENKDVCIDRRDCHGDLNGGTDTCFDGDLWPRYNAMVCASWIANDQQTNWGQHYFSNDMGPIAWPSTGYVQANGIKATCGIGIPSSILYNGYVYVFFMDHGPYGGLNPADEEGRRGGIKVVRARLGDVLDPNAYEAYYRDTAGHDTWNPSLPEGFTKETMLNFLRVKGPMMTDLMGESPWTSAPLRFSVAAVKNANYFIGVESYIDLADGNRYKTALRCSSDLLHWSPRMLVISNAADFTSSTMNYPILLSRDGLSNTTIDADDFYVVGTSPGNRVNATVYKLHVTAPSAGNFTMGLMSTVSTTFSVDDHVHCFPNPCSGVCTLALGRASGEVTIGIFDMEGRRVGSTQWSGLLSGPISQRLDLSAFAPGLYVIKVWNSGIVSTLKIVRD